MFLDIGVGILVALLVGSLHGVKVSLSFIVAGIVFSLLPDLDFIISAIAHRSFKNGAARHRAQLHLPLLYIPVGTILLLFFSIPLAELFFLVSLAHFLHDSIGVGWGVQWLYPFSKDHYSFLYIYKPAFRAKKLPRKLFYVWKNDQIEQLDAEFGDRDWVRHIYGGQHWYAVLEEVVLVVSVIVGIWYMYR